MTALKKVFSRSDAGKLSHLIAYPTTADTLRYYAPRNQKVLERAFFLLNRMYPGKQSLNESERTALQLAALSDHELYLLGIVSADRHAKQWREDLLFQVFHRRHARILIEHEFHLGEAAQSEPRVDGPYLRRNPLIEPAFSTTIAANSFDLDLLKQKLGPALKRNEQRFRASLPHTLALLGLRLDDLSIAELDVLRIQSVLDGELASSGVLGPLSDSANWRNRLVETFLSSAPAARYRELRLAQAERDASRAPTTESAILDHQLNSRVFRALDEALDDLDSPQPIGNNPFESLAIEVEESSFLRQAISQGRHQEASRLGIAIRNQ